MPENPSFPPSTNLLLDLRTQFPALTSALAAMKEGTATVQQVLSMIDIGNIRITDPRRIALANTFLAAMLRELEMGCRPSHAPQMQKVAFTPAEPDGSVS